MKLREIKSIKERRQYVSKMTGAKLEATGIYPQDIEKAQEHNCENMIGVTCVPLGVAGPIKILGDFAKGDYYLPLATSEGALVASINRGCRAITESGGAAVFVEKAGVTRGAVFSTKGHKDSLCLKTWLKDNLSKVKETAQSTSSYLILTGISTSLIGRDIFVRFAFDTGEAMGMNMVTIASEKIVKLVEEETGIKCLSLAGNFDTDKKPSWLNFIQGRGRKVWAEVIIKNEVVNQVLKTDAQKIHNVAVKKCLLGSAVSGTIGFNAHFANVIAAVFIACGQDVAHTVEGSLGVTTTEIDREGLYISVYLPDLMLGTVGGGTGLPCQKEALDILGVLAVNDGHQTDRFAEILAGGILAGELSLLAALSQGALASSHRKLARGEKL